MMIKCKHCNTFFERGESQKRVCSDGYCPVNRKRRYRERER